MTFGESLVKALSLVRAVVGLSLVALALLTSLDPDRGSGAHDAAPFSSSASGLTLFLVMLLGVLLLAWPLIRVGVRRLRGPER